MRKILMLALFLTAAAAAAQTVELGPWARGIAPLDQGWKTHAGDNPAWAAPTFDDSSGSPSPALMTLRMSGWPRPASAGTASTSISRTLLSRSPSASSRQRDPRMSGSTGTTSIP